MGILAKTMGVAALTAAGTTAAAWLTDDGIAGCLKGEDNRAYFQFDDGSVSAEPVLPLSFDDAGENCYVSHGGNTPPDFYPRVDVEGSDYAQRLANEAADFSNAQWEQIQPVGEIAEYEVFTAYLNGSEIQIADEGGDLATGVLATAFSDTFMPVSVGTEDHPVIENFEDPTVGSVVISYESDEGIRVARVPAVSGPNFIFE